MQDQYLLRYQLFLKHTAPQFKRVFVLSGNLEYRSSTGCEKDGDKDDSDQKNKEKQAQQLGSDVIADRIQGMCDSFNNVQFLNRSIANLEGVKLIGATLWCFLHVFSLTLSQ